MPTNSTNLIGWSDCVGTLTVDGKTADVRCTVDCDRQGQVVVQFANIPLSRETQWLLSVVHSEAYGADLNVQAPDGTHLTGEHLFFTSIGTPFNREGQFLSLVAQPSILIAQFLVQPLNEAGTDVSTISYHTVGMLGFPGVTGVCEEGEVVVGGPTKVSDFQSITGHVAFRRVQDESSLNNWLAACDNRVTSILRMVSFGLGRFVDWSVRSLYLRGVLRQIRFVGPSRHSTPAEPPFHFLNLQPALDIALRHHDLLSDQAVGIGEAIDWLTPWNTFAEVRFLSAITAFECLLSRNERPTTVLKPETFQRLVRPELASVLRSDELHQRLAELPADSEPTPTEKALEEFEAKLGNLNQRSLSTRLEAYLDHYQVPISDLPLSVRAIVSARHRVVHGARGRGVSSSITVTDHAGAIRELLRRTILALLGYSGHFNSYVGATGWIEFRNPLTPQA
jgi:hypothetical protein